MKQPDPNELIERPDGSMIAFEKLEPEDQIAHEFVTTFFPKAEKLQQDMIDLKRATLSEMVASRQMMFDDLGVSKGGKKGNMTLRSACGRMLVRMTISKHVSFGSELEAAKTLIFEVVNDELTQGGSPLIKAIVEDVFSLNSKGRIDTAGILNLRNDKYAKEVKDPRWDKAMVALEKAIIRDVATTYVNFYAVDPHAPTRAEGENRIVLDLAKLPLERVDPDPKAED